MSLVNVMDDICINLIRNTIIIYYHDYVIEDEGNKITKVIFLYEIGYNAAGPSRCSV